MDFVYGNNLGIYDNLNHAIQTNFSGISPLSIFLVIVVIIGFIFMIQFMFSLGSGDSGSTIGNFDGFGSDTGVSGSSSFIMLIKIMIIGIIIGLIVVNGLQYLYNINFTAKVSDILTNNPKVSVDVKQDIPKGKLSEKPRIVKKKEVFHIPGNVYTYDDAKAVCKAYNAELATLDQIENAYDKGAEWCSYGWSQNQMAFFPTQKKTWQKLQEIKGHEHDCGRPGINGGHIKNKNVKFGVNCYGYKPRMNAKERKIVENTSLFPKTMKDKYEEYKVNHYRRNLKNIALSPFNKETWFQL